MVKGAKSQTDALPPSASRSSTRRAAGWHRSTVKREDRGKPADARPPEQLREVITFRRADRREASLSELPLPQLLGTDETVRAENVVFCVPDGRSLRTLLNATPVRAEGGAIRSVLVSLQDLAPLDEIERLRTEFLGLISHELREPLGAIKGSAARRQRSQPRLHPEPARGGLPRGEAGRRLRTPRCTELRGFRERGGALSLSYNGTPSTRLGFTAMAAPSWGDYAPGRDRAAVGRPDGLRHGLAPDVRSRRACRRRGGLRAAGGRALRGVGFRTLACRATESRPLPGVEPVLRRQAQLDLDGYESRNRDNRPRIRQNGGSRTGRTNARTQHERPARPARIPSRGSRVRTRATDGEESPSDE